MSSYASQSQYQHQNTDQTTEASQSETQQSPPQGNQAQVESAGLEGGGCDDDSMNGPFAHLLLDGMPLGAAIDTALRCLENPVVQDWLRHVPDAHLIDLFADDPSLIDFILSGVMPVLSLIHI